MLPSRALLRDALVVISAILLSQLASVCFREFVLFDDDDASEEAAKWNNVSQLASSVWCNGDNHISRRCHFQNLCYKRDTNDYLFLKSNELSVISGVPDDRSKPALCDLSSVDNHNQYYFNFVEVDALYAKKLFEKYSLRFVKGHTMIFGRFKPDNIMHLLHDDIIPLFASISELRRRRVQRMNLFADDAYTPINETSYIYNEELYAKLFKTDLVLHVTQVQSEEIVCFEDASVGLNKNTVWYNYGFREPQRPVTRSRTDQRFLRKTSDLIYSKLVGEDGVCEETFATVISRVNTRLILNEDELKASLSRILNETVYVLNVEDFPRLSDLLARIRCTTVLVGMHGSALSLALFMREGSSLIELFPFAIDSSSYTPYKTLADYMNIRYFSWTNEIKKNSLPHPEYPSQLGGIEHLPTSEREAIEANVKDIPQHLCCTDAMWLYHIYQDTYVDVVSFERTLSRVTNDSDKQQLREHISSAPGPVLHAKCNRIEKHVVNLSWNAPWNLFYLSSGVQRIKYEILIQFPTNKTATAIVTFDTNASFEVNESDIAFVWIRCYINVVNGPFIREPLKC